MPTTTASPATSASSPASLRSPPGAATSTSLGHFSPASTSASRRTGPTTDSPASSGSQPQRGARRRRAGGAAPRRSAPTARAPTSCGPAGPSRRSGARRPATRPSGRPARRGGDQVGVGRPGLVDHVEPRPQPALDDERPAQRRLRAAAGGRGLGRGSARLTTLRRHEESPMSADPAATTAGTEVPDDIDVHTTAGKLADLHRRNDEAVHAGSERAVEKQHAKGKMTARERIDALLDEGSFVEMDELARHRSTAFGLEKTRPYGDGVVTGYGTVDGRPVCVFAQDFTVFGGVAGRGVRREDRQGDGPGAQDRLPGDRHQRLRRRPDPGGRRLARPLRRDLLPQRDGVRRGPADLADHGAVRGRRRLLARDHRLHRDGRPEVLHVHHRPRRHQDRHRRGRDPGGPGRRPDAQHQVGQRALPRAATRPTRSTTSRRCCPTCPSNNLEDPPRSTTTPRRWRSPTRTASSTRSSPTRPTSRTTCTR